MSRLGRWPRRFQLWGLLCLVLVLGQGIGLNHQHDGDLQKQFDCEVCLKTGSTDDGLTNSPVIHVTPAFVAVDAPRHLTPSRRRVALPPSRAPPVIA